MGYCTAPRDMLALSCTCKTLRAAITTPLVVKVAMMYGGNSKKSMNEIYTVMKQSSIYIPSPHRLLRLASGRYYEVCHKTKTNGVLPNLGLHVCASSCCLTSDWRTSRRANCENLRHRRVAGKKFASVSIVLAAPFFVNGKREGPLVSRKDVEDMVRRGITIEQYLTKQAPAMSEYQEFIDAYESCRDWVETMYLCPIVSSFLCFGVSLSWRRAIWRLVGCLLGPFLRPLPWRYFQHDFHGSQEAPEGHCCQEPTFQGAKGTEYHCTAQVSFGTAMARHGSGAWSRRTEAETIL